jgi:hypothetical protein
MSQTNVVAPRLPAAPVQYDQQFMQQFLNILRLYFAQLDNAGPIAGASQNIGSTTVVSGLNFSQPTPHTNPITYQASLPTQADLSNLRKGDVYYDTSASNVLKIKV